MRDSTRNERRIQDTEEFHPHAASTFFKTYCNNTTIYREPFRDKEDSFPLNADVYFSGRLEHAIPTFQGGRAVLRAAHPNCSLTPNKLTFFPDGFVQNCFPWESAPT